MGPSENQQSWYLTIQYASADNDTDRVKQGTLLFEDRNLEKMTEKSF